MSEPMTVWVLIHHDGYEGHGEPIAVFADQKAAEDAQELVKIASYDSDWRLYPLPLRATSARPHDGRGPG